MQTHTSGANKMQAEARQVAEIAPNRQAFVKSRSKNFKEAKVGSVEKRRSLARPEPGLVLQHRSTHHMRGIPCPLHERNDGISPKETEGNTDGNTDGYTDWDFTGGSPSTADTPEHTPTKNGLCETVDMNDSGAKVGGLVGREGWRTHTLGANKIASRSASGTRDRRGESVCAYEPS